ncbi:MAG: hypothetical protein US74_C0034G0011 [Parcubacteria group bacterium GW2011_GWA2_38_13]|uniref:Nicotianamine synthase protein n=1 Tax=Candidatus Roizmanbacteria bacterium GW2011_GWC2_35_12 TaxID=1618485 RepID=A0A0G0EEA8_9BACT|nr:MAG: hypothetical protein UR63_C0047G0005 [Candidatus Roizmanbacteria bacterium GW2011_GWC2_35_12]KKQ55346.1 MAG: hypothetical protein US74_C0034G0011 [Parcubacteria group bacterium GW2011_GWA2_38_13]
MIKRHLNIIKKSLKKLGIYLTNNHSLNLSKIKKSMSILENIFSIHNLNSKDFRELIKYCKENNFLSLFQKSYETYEINLEKEFAKSFIKEKNNNDKNNLKKYHFYNGYLAAVKKEASLARIKPNDKVAFIGSGAMPMTAIILYELKEASIDCIEKDGESVELSKKIIKKLKYDKYIKVINRNAIDLNFSKYSVILLAVMSKPKNNLMKVVWKSILPGTRIVYRLPNIVRQALYEDTSNVINTYRKFEKKRVRRKGSSTLILLVKN